MKLGLDIHGVIDANREFFSELTEVLMRDNVYRLVNNQPVHEIHILTGPSLANIKPKELEGISYSHFFSIVDHGIETGATVMYDGKGEPWMDQYEWNRAKGDYARKHKLDLHIDDSVIYPNFFTTPICCFKSCKEWIKQANK